MKIIDTNERLSYSALFCCNAWHTCTWKQGYQRWVFFLESCKVRWIENTLNKNKKSNNHFYWEQCWQCPFSYFCHKVHFVSQGWVCWEMLFLFWFCNNSLSFFFNDLYVMIIFSDIDLFLKKTWDTIELLFSHRSRESSSLSWIINRVTIVGGM